MTNKLTELTIVEIKVAHEDRLVIRMSDGNTTIQGSTTASEIFGTIKSLAAELVADDWKIAGQINRLDRSEFVDKFKLLLSGPVSMALDNSKERMVQELRIVLRSLHDREIQRDGIFALANAMAEEAKQDDNDISRLIDRMYADTGWSWNQENQGPSKYSGKAWGAEFSMVAVHAVGNWYVAGHVGLMSMRVYKTHSTVQIYLTTTDQFDMGHCDLNFSVNNKEEFFDWIKGLAARQAGK